jgi:UDP-glucose 4-epimerase
MAWLITGGAGYIGSHVVDYFFNAGLNLVVFDNESTGFRSRVDGKATFENGDIRNIDSIRNVFLRHQIDGVIHLAALKSVEESLQKPDMYFDVNVKGTQNLVDIAAEYKIDKLLFSSSAAVYGNSKSGKVTENSELAPLSPYGNSKLIAEKIVFDFGQSTRAGTCSLRYFNVAGSESRLLTDRSVSNLIPMVIDQIRKNEIPRIFGTDYPTPDGSCVRDYIHVSDVSLSHSLVAMKLNDLDFPKVLNIGTGQGVSVKDVVTKCLEVMHSDLGFSIENRRDGDPADLSADVSLFEKVVGKLKMKDLEAIIKSSVLYAS